MFRTELFEEQLKTLPPTSIVLVLACAVPFIMAGLSIVIVSVELGFQWAIYLIRAVILIPSFV